jgi:succinate dehydrogenase / fumarate reductase cytochrome b subunit
MASAASTVRHPKGPPEREPARGAGALVWAALDSSVGAKVVVALTGLGLAGFVVIHLIGNLKMFSGRESVNDYAHFLKHDLGLLLWFARGGLLALFLLHIVLAVRLKLRSVAARPVPYQHAGSVQATIASRTMVWTGIVVGLFVAFHLAHFTFGWVKKAEVAPGVYQNYLELQHDGKHDVYSMVVAGFTNPVIVVLYVAAQVFLFVHLLHGIQSAFQTLGLKNGRFAPVIRALGVAVALTVLVGNLAIVFAVWVGVVPPVYSARAVVGES